MSNEKIQLTKIDALPTGAQRVHLGSVVNTFSPRGTMRKNSLSASVFEKMADALDSYTDPKYADAGDPDSVRDAIIANLRAEIDSAIDWFNEFVNVSQPGVDLPADPPAPVAYELAQLLGRSVTDWDGHTHKCNR